MTLWEKHSLVITAKDSKDNPRTVGPQSFWGGSFTGYDLILGWDWLQEADPMISFRSGTFVWGELDTTNRLQVCSLDSLLSDVEQGETIYQLHPETFTFDQSVDVASLSTFAQGGGDRNPDTNPQSIVHAYALELQAHLHRACASHPVSPLAPRGSPRQHGSFHDPRR